MKKQFYILINLAMIMAFISCDVNEPIKLQEKFATFETTSGAVSETAPLIGIPVLIAAPGGEGTTVSFEFSTEGIANPAIEGEDFNLVNASKSITFNTYYGVDTIWIEPIDDADYNKNVEVNIIITSLTNGYINTGKSIYKLTLNDNEHPLGNWIGNYTANALSYGNPGVWDETWAVVTSPNPDDETQLLISIEGGPNIVATIDLNLNTITLKAKQDIGPIYGYGPTLVYNYDGAYPTTDDLVGTINPDGSFVFTYWAHVLPDYGDYLWDIFNPTFTKN
ncbi:MAG: hypothetical protein U0W24_20655 [Bacteroidales bacterium]